MQLHLSRSCEAGSLEQSPPFFQGFGSHRLVAKTKITKFDHFANFRSRYAKYNCSRVACECHSQDHMYGTESLLLKKLCRKDLKKYSTVDATKKARIMSHA